MTPDLPRSAPTAESPRKPSTLAEFGALLGDPARAAIVLHLSDGSRRPAGELASLAGLSPQAITRHLARLVDGGLLAVEPQGRHRVFGIASGEAADAIEALTSWIDEPRRACRHDPDLRRARLCYDHVAGRLGVALFDGMVSRGWLDLARDGPRLTETGRASCGCHGLLPPQASGSRRPLVRLCLDWTERRPHLGGRLGASIASGLFDQGFLVPGSRRRALAAGARRREITVTAKGSAFFRATFGIDARTFDAAD